MKYIYTILVTLVGYGAYAQEASISGRLQAEGEDLAFATIALEGTEWGTTTDEAGQFNLTKLPAGTYQLVASYVGYLPQRKKVELRAGQILQIELELATGLAMDEIVVTGTMKATYVSDSPIKIDVITAKQLERFMPTASSSVVESIQLINGVQEVVACGVCLTNSISINGLAGAYTAILMDGTPMYGNLAAVYGLNGIPNMIIDRIEVIKGPSSTLYGSEAVAGVINVITKDPAEQPLLAIDIMGTSHMESFGNLALAPRIGRTSGYLGLNYAYVNDFDDINADGFGDGVNLDRFSLFSKWNIFRESGKKFSLAAKYYYEDRRNGVEAFLRDRAYQTLRGSDEIYGESIYTRRAELFGTYVFATDLDIKFDFSLSDHQQDSYYGSDNYRASQQIAFGNLIWNVEGTKHDIGLGLTGRYQYYNDNTVATTKIGPDSARIDVADRQFIAGIFAQDEYRPGPQWTFLAGMRLDHYPAHGLITAPRLSIKYKPSDWTTLRTNFGTGFRIVNLFTEDHAFVTGQRTVEIQEALAPERSYNGTFNIHHIYTLGPGSGSIDLEAYYTHFRNKIIPDYDTPGKIIYANADGFARTMGIGLSTQYSFAFPLSCNLGINLQRASEVEYDENDQPQSRDIAFAPAWSGIFTANYRWKKAAIDLAYTARITGPMALPEVFDLDASGQPLAEARPTRSEVFALHNVQVSKKINDRWSLYLGLQNLFNFRQTTSPLIGYNDPNAATGFSDFFDTSYAYAPNHGREFYLGVQWNLAKD